MNGSTIAIRRRARQLADRAARRPRGSCGRGVLRIDAQQHLAALEARPRHGRGVVPGEPVVDLEDRAGEPAAVHRADDDLAVECAHEQQVLDDVGGAEHPVDARTRERLGQPPEQLPAGRPWPARPRRRAAHRGPGGRRRPASAGRCAPMRPLRSGARGGQLGDPARVAHAGPHQSLMLSVWLMRAPSRTFSSSSLVGIASAQASRPATTAPAALANRRIRSTSQPDSRPWHSAPPNASPAPSPFTTSTGTGGTTTDSSPRTPSTPSGPCLTIAKLHPGLAQRGGGALRVALADRHVALLEVAHRDVDQVDGGADVLVCLLARRPEHRPVVEVEDGGAVRRRGPSVRPWWRSSTAPPTGRCRSPRRCRPPRSRRGRARRPGSGGRGRSAVGRSRAGSRPAGRSRRTSPASAARRPAVT